MSKKSLLTEMRDTQVAIELIELGARPQVLESETTLSRERLLKLYKEVKGVSPPKGMLPFSTDWFLTWLPTSIPRCSSTSTATSRRTANAAASRPYSRAIACIRNTCTPTRSKPY